MYAQTLDKAKQQLQSNKYNEAIKTLDGLLDSTVELSLEQLIDIGYLYAVCLRKLDKHREALIKLDQVKSLNSNYARAFQEAGYNYQLLNQDETALLAFTQAVTINPTLVNCWQVIALSLKSENKLEEAEFALNQFKYYKQLAPELLTAYSLFYEKKFYKSELICRHYLQENPQNIEAMLLLAKLGIKQQVMDDAEFLLESAVEFEPSHVLARQDYAVLLARRQKFEKSYQQAQILLQQDQNNIQFNIILADAISGIGKPSDALKIYKKVLSANPKNHLVHLSYGHTLKTVGKLNEAIAAYHQSALANKNFGDAYWSLANLKTYNFSDDEIDIMRAKVTDKDLTNIDTIHFYFALGKGLEDRKQYDESFQCYLRGNQLKNISTGYSKEQLDKRLQSHFDNCTSALFESKKDMGCTDASPIFIVGLPRAGSTLLEQILASHSQIDGTMELPNILGMAYKLQGRRRLDEEQRYPAILYEMQQQQFTGLGKKYIDETFIHRKGAPFFIDKMPNNFIHIALIQLILPNAKIIDARRHPMSCCLSGFKQLFGEGQDFSYGLEEIGRYYRSYVQLMDHWDKVLPNKILRVQHEDVVDDLELQVRRILDYCQLPFEQSCLEYYNNNRDVRTPSAEQVRQPIYRSGLEQWRNYEPFLQPLKDALGDDILKRYPI